MSRSAMEKQARQQPDVSATPAAQPAAVMYPGVAMGYDPYAMAAYAAANGMYMDPTAAAMMQMAPVSYVPIKGDDEDYEDPAQRMNVLSLHGNTSNFNINTLLFDNIMTNDYFKALYNVHTYHEVLTEAQRSLKHVEPWQTGTSRLPSSAYCLLVKFLLMRLTIKQMNGILGMHGYPLVRAVGLLYLRYTAPPTDLWKWFEPLIEDDEDIRPASDKSIHMTIGAYCIKLLTEMQYYGTTLPRIPVLIERKLKVLLLLLDEKKRRRVANRKLVQDGYFRVGSKVQAIYSDEENEPAWYEAIITQSLDSDNNNDDSKLWVTFPEYGNSECVDLGDMKLNKEDEEKANKHSTSNRRSRSRSPPPRNKEDSRDDLMQRVINSERAASAAVGRNYGNRPASYKGSLSMKADTFNNRVIDRSPPRDRERERRKRSRSPSPRNSSNNYRRERDGDSHRGGGGNDNRDQRGGRDDRGGGSGSGGGQDRMKMLKEKYGDASSLTK